MLPSLSRSGSYGSVSWSLLLCIGIIAVTMEQFIHLTQPDSLSKKARPPLPASRRVQLGEDQVGSINMTVSISSDAPNSARSLTVSSENE